MNINSLFNRFKNGESLTKTNRKALNICSASKDFFNYIYKDSNNNNRLKRKYEKYKAALPS